MKGMKLWLLSLILNIISSSTLFIKQRLKRSTDPDFFWEFPYETIFQQKLDHFNPADDRKWNQRYWITVTHYRKNGPAFLFVNGQRLVDETQEFGFSRQGLIFAKELNAICFSLEHRYYGKTWPTNETMHYLSIGQALEDVANFIKHMTAEFKLPINTKWFAIGCSYGGALAAWAKFKYPQLVSAAIASGPALQAKVDYFEYVQIVEASLRAYSPKCIESITLGIQEIARLQNFSQLLYLCDNPPEDSVTTIKNILLQMIGIFSNAVQNGINLEFTIPTVCDVMNRNKGSELKAFAELRKIHEKYRENHLSIASKNQQNDVPYRYQRCSEFGFFTSYNTSCLSAAKHLLPIETDIKNSCEQFFGPNFGVKELSAKINRTNSLYRGLDFNVENVVFIYGSLDPWYKAGLYKKTNQSLFETIFIKGISHCDDLNLDSDVDIPELKNARKKILDLLKMWLNENSKLEKETINDAQNESL